MTYRVTGFVSKRHIDQDNREHYPIIGKVTFQCSDYYAASHFANNIPDIPDCTMNVDFEMAVPISRRRVWVDANIRELEHAATTLMEAAQSIRDRKLKPRVVLAAGEQADD